MGEGQLPKNAEKVGLGLIPFSLCLLGALCVMVARYFHGHMNIGLEVWRNFVYFN